MELIHARPMGDFVGQHTPQRRIKNRCPVCGGPKNQKATTCIACRPVKQVSRDADTMDNHHRWNAALEAGWTEGQLMEMRPNIPTWEQIIERDPGVVIERWWNSGA